MAKRTYNKNDHRKVLEDTTINDIDIGGGVLIEGDIVTHYELVDRFLADYGMGGCRSLDEYSEMVNLTDPSLINGLLVCMNDRKQLESGVDPYKGDSHKDDPPSQVSVGKKAPSTPARKKVRRGGGECDMVDFLVKSGADWKEIKKIRDDIRDGKTSIKIKDFSEDFDTRTLLHDKDFDLQKQIDEMMAYKKQSENYAFNFSKVRM
jgi:hypothetical protein